MTSAQLIASCRLTGTSHPASWFISVLAFIVAHGFATCLGSVNSEKVANAWLPGTSGWSRYSGVAQAIRKGDL